MSMMNLFSPPDWFPADQPPGHLLAVAALFAGLSALATVFALWGRKRTVREEQRRLERAARIKTLLTETRVVRQRQVTIRFNPRA